MCGRLTALKNKKIYTGVMLDGPQFLTAFTPKAKDALKILSNLNKAGIKPLAVVQGEKYDLIRMVQALKAIDEKRDIVYAA